jgi:hypothetical protein
LEEELAKSRSKEAELMRECQQLRASLENALLQLSQQGIGMAFDGSYPPTESVALSKTTGSSNGASPFYFNDLGTQPRDTIPSPQMISPESFGDFHGITESYQRLPILFGQGGVAYNCRVGDVDQVTAGMEFVLK